MADHTLGSAENAEWDHVHKNTLISMQCSERDFGEAKWEELRLRGQTPGFKSGLHYLLVLWPLGSYLSSLVGDYVYRGMFGIWWTQLIVAIIMQRQGITIIIVMIFFLLLFSVLEWVMWPFHNLLNDISFRLISEWDCVPGLLMWVGGEAKECKASRGSSSRSNLGRGGYRKWLKLNFSLIENPWMSSL